MPIKYNYKLLESFCNEKNVKLAYDYSNESLFGSSKINFYCTNCNNKNIKCFTYLIKRNTLCKRCVTIESLPKQKETMMKRYGVEHPSHSDDIKSKIKDGFIKKWGVDNPSKTDIVKNKMKKTCLEKYGVEYLINNENIREKMKTTCLEKYGVENAISNSEIREKIKKTCLEKYGVDNPGKCIDFQEKMKQTMVQKYGVEFPLQNEIIAENTIKKCFKQKEFIFPSGKIIKCQGYEPFALTDLLSEYNEEQIITGCKNVPKLWYLDSDGNRHRHFVDIYIPDANLCVEVKSTWTLKYKTEYIYKKQKQAKLDGYKYEIWVYDDKGIKINKII